MKSGRFLRIAPPLALPLLALLLMALVLAGCGGEEGTGVTTPTPVTSPDSTTSGAAGPGTTVAGLTSTTAPGGAAAIPSKIPVRLTGDQQVPLVETDATGTFTLIVSRGAEAGADTSSTSQGLAGGLLPPGSTVSYVLEVEDVEDATAAHIHLGAKGQNGDVIYPLFTGPQKDGEFTGVLAEGPLNAGDLTGPYKGKTLGDLVEAVVQGDTYVNVHTAENPNGAIRGQIMIRMNTSMTEPLP